MAFYRRFTFKASTAIVASMFAGIVLAAGGDVVSEIEKNNSLKNFSNLVEKSGLQNDINNQRNVTVFAPTDQAFQQDQQKAVQDLQKPENQAKLRDFLQGHIASGSFDPQRVSEQPMTLTTLNGDTIEIKKVGKDIIVDNNAVVVATEDAENGTVYIISRLINTDALPEGTMMRQGGSSGSSTERSSDMAPTTDGMSPQPNVNPRNRFNPEATPQ